MKNVDSKELSKFAALAPIWWDRNGAFKALHDINGLRVGYINGRAPLAGRRVLDLGCGGGILSEAMAALGAEVTGIDAGEEPLAAARLHLQESGLRVDYRQAMAEPFVEQAPESFDVVVVPILGLFWGQRPSAGTWSGAGLAAAGLYLLSITETFRMEYGDGLVLVSAFFWSLQVLLVAWLSPRTRPVELAFYQFSVCALLSLFTAALLESFEWASVMAAAGPILYGGVLSVGVAYTLQVVAQREAHPAHASILMSLEAVFAAIGGWLMLGETLSPRGLAGCALMLAGMLVSQLWALKK
jgi:SAM-dependent methyltransferase